MRKPVLICICLLLSLALLPTGGAAVAKQNATVDLFYSAAWHEVTSRVYTRDQITINHGAGDEQGGLVPSDASLTFDNRDGEMNPENRKSSLFGLIGHNTPIRIKVGSDIRFSGQIVSWKPRRAIKGDAWVDVAAQGTIRRLGQGEPPVLSALYRSISGIAAGDYVPFAYWPMEDVSGAEFIGNATGGGSPMTFSDGVTLAADSGLSGSKPLPTFTSTGFATAVIPGYVNTNKWVVQVALKIDAEPASDTTYLEVDSPGGDNVLWRLNILPGSPAIVAWRGYNSAGAITGTDATKTLLGGAFGPSEADFFGKWWFYTLTSYVDAGEVWAGLNFSDTVFEQTNAGANGLTVHAAATQVRLLGGNGASFGHLGFFKDANFDVIADALDNAAAIYGHNGETAGARFTRLCREEDIASTIVGTEADTQPMGPQYPDTTLNLLEEIAETDAGIIHDTRSQLGLTLRTGRSLYNQ